MDNESLKNLLGVTCKPKASKIADINDTIEANSQVPNYGIVNPGKLLGSFLMITNI